MANVKKFMDEVLSALEVNEEKPKDRNDPPPKTVHHIGFWTWQTICWIFYGLMTLIYIPYAVVLHIIFALVITLVGCLPYWSHRSRKPFVLMYVLTVMMPGKYLWYNLFRDNRRRGKIWDYEMARPRAVPVQKRRRISDAGLEKPQTASLLLKLPAEIRLRIYKEIIVGEADFLSIIEPPTQSKNEMPKDRRPRAHPCFLFGTDRDEAILESNLRILHRTPRMTLSEPLAMGLPLLQTCRQVYREAINLMYSLPAFNFKDIHKPPFFINGVLPQRLAHIRSVHLVYDQTYIVKSNHVGCETARFSHKIGECKWCNPIQWVNGIKKYMVNLKTVETFFFLKKEQRVPSMGDTFIARLFDLQVGSNGLRHMKIDVSPKDADDEFSIIALIDEEDYVKRVKRFNERMQRKLKEGIDRYNACERELKKQAERRKRGLPPIAPPPKAQTRSSKDSTQQTSDGPVSKVSARQSVNGQKRRDAG